MAAFSLLDLNTFKWWAMFLVETLSKAVIRGGGAPSRWCDPATWELQERCRQTHKYTLWKWETLNCSFPRQKVDDIILLSVIHALMLHAAQEKVPFLNSEYLNWSLTYLWIMQKSSRWLSFYDEEDTCRWTRSLFKRKKEQDWFYTDWINNISKERCPKITARIRNCDSVREEWSMLSFVH